MLNIRLMKIRGCFFVSGVYDLLETGLPDMGRRWKTLQISFT